MSEVSIPRADSLEIGLKEGSLVVDGIAWHKVLLETWADDDFGRARKQRNIAYMIPMPMTCHAIISLALLVASMRYVPPYDSLHIFQVDSSPVENLTDVLLNFQAQRGLE